MTVHYRSPLCKRTPLGTVTAEFGDQVEETEVGAQLADLQDRKLTEESAATPGRWQLTEREARLGMERKARSS